MRRLCAVLTLLAVAVVAPPPVSAQQTGTISGRVTDANTARPLGGAQVIVAGTTRGDRTDASGAFTISGLPAGVHRVSASLIGYTGVAQTVTLTGGGVSTVNLALSPSAVQISGVVVNAVTGESERRRELGTNVSSIRAEDIARAPITKPADVLTGRAAGVTVQTSGGTAGTSQRIRIRGANSLSLSNEPLIYIDGVQVSNRIEGVLNAGGLGNDAGGAASSRLNDINPSDVETIEILKGPAATSAYGTAAANGVVLITTRRGVAGRPRWNAYSEFGQIDDTNDYPANWSSYQVNTPNQPIFRPNGTVNIGTTPATSTARRACNNVSAAQGICRQDSTAVFNLLEDPRSTPLSTGSRQRFGASVAGGTGTTTFYVSGDQERERGVISYNVLNKANLRANFSTVVADRLRLQASSGYTDSNLRINSNDNSVFSPLIESLRGRAFFNPDTTRAMYNPNFGFGLSPKALAEYVPMERVNRLVLGSQANLTVGDWLTGNLSGGLDWIGRFNENTVQPNRDIAAIAPDYYGPGVRSVERSTNYVWTLNGSLVAEREWSPSVYTTTTVGGSFNRDQFRSLYSEGVGVVEGTADLGGTAEQFLLDERFTENRTIGVFASQQIAFADRLFLTVGGRGDRNSSFGTEFGFAFYPNVNVSYVISEEPWFPSVDAISSLRLRSGYGTSGLRPAFRDAVTLYAPTAVQVSGSDIPAVLLSRTGNEGLKPERTTEVEAGLDLGLFRDRLSAGATWYRKRSTDALISVPIPPSFGRTGATVATSTRLANIGRIQNSGAEFQLDARVIEAEPVQLNFRLVSSLLRNEVLSIGDAQDIVVGRGDQLHRKGYPAGAFFQNRYVVNDANGDRKIAPSEVRIVRDSLDGKPVPHYVGPALPTHTNALSGELTLFRTVTIGTLFEQRGGNYQLDFTTEFRCRTAVVAAGQGCEFTMNPNASIEDQARVVAGTLGTRHGYIHKADFLKWRELSVTLQVPDRLVGDFSLLRGASVVLSGRNLKTWTDYPGLDPEVTESATGNFTQNEFNTAPPVRYLTARLNLTF